MYGLSQQAWSATVDLVHSDLRTVKQSGYNVIIYTSDSPPNTGLTTGLAVRALFDVIVSMTTEGLGFYKVTTNIKSQGRAIGRIHITNIDPTSSPTISNHDPLNTTSTLNVLDNHASRSVNTSLVTYSGNIPDPDDERFEVSYQYDSKNLRSQEVLSAMLAGLANVAQYNDDGPCPWISAVSSTGNLVLHVGGLPSEVLLGWHISRMIYLLVYHLFLVQRILKEMSFTLFYYGTPIAEGYMKSMRSVGGDGGTGLAATQ